MNKLKLIAVFMICLVLSLPVYSASVIAGINKIDSYGEDNVNGYIKDNDMLYIDVNAFVTGETVTPEKLRVGSVYFETCSESPGGGYDCSMSYNLMGLLVGDETLMTVYLYDNAGLNSGNYIDSDTFVLRKDTVNPEVDVEIDEKLIAKDDNITLRYDIKDEANSAPDECSGIEKIELYVNDLGSTPEEIEFSDTGCKIDDVIKRAGASLSTETEGIERVTVYVKTYDKMGNSEVDGDYFDIDLSAPVIDTGSLMLIKEGYVVEYISNDSTTLSVHINVTSDSIALMKINLSGRLMDMSCEEINDGDFACVVDDIAITSSPFEAEFIAVDNAGNRDVASVSKTLSVDGTRPELISLETDAYYDEKYYIKEKDNTIFAVIKEEDSGFYGNNVFLDLSGVGNYGIVEGNCTKEDNWVCVWKNIDTNKADSSKITIKITDDSSDDVDNLISGELTSYVYVDKSIPVKVGDVFVSAVGSEEESEYEWIIKSGDNIKVNATILDATPVSASGNFSNLDMGILDGTCDSDDLNRQECEIFTASNDGVPTGPYTTTIELFFEDIVGNELSIVKQIDVHGIENDTNPNYWGHSVECSPSLVDRQITPYINQLIYCHVNLIPNVPEQEPETLSIDLGNCISDSEDYDSTDYLHDREIINDAPGSIDPYIEIELQTSEMLLDELKFICPLAVRSKVLIDAENYVTGYDEIENVSISIEFYNNPLGTLDESIEDKIEDVKESAFVSWEWIQWMSNIVKWMRKLCSILDAVNRIATIFAQLEAIWSGFEFGPLHTISEAASEASTLASWSDLNWWAKAYRFCAYVSCNRGLWDEWYVEYIYGEGRDVDDWFRKHGFSQATIWPQNTQDSIVLSMATGCIPGIIYGAQKWRQIKCQYALCLRDGVEMSVPIKYCEDQKSYLTCKFLMGEVFHVIPYASFVKSIGSYIETLVSDPLSLILGLHMFWCEMDIGGEGISAGKIGHAICVINRAFAETGLLIQDVRSFMDTQDWILEEDLCKELLDEEEDDEEETEEEGSAWS